MAPESEDERMEPLLGSHLDESKVQMLYDTGDKKTDSLVYMPTAT